MNRHLAMILQLVTVAVSMVLILIFGLYDNISAVRTIGFITIGIMLFLSYQLRCRSCGRWLGRGHFFDEYCPSCGAYLDDE